MSEGNERDIGEKGQSERIPADQKTVDCELERQVSTEFDHRLGALLEMIHVSPWRSSVT